MPLRLLLLLRVEGEGVLEVVPVERWLGSARSP